MIYYISDQHFFHRNINVMDKRGFETMFELHDYMIEKWNKKVTNNDTVYILGDFSFGKGVETWNILTKLNGNKILIEGNHDYNYLDDEEFVDIVLDNIYSYLEINDGGKKVILSHYPLSFYNFQFYKDKEGELSTFMLYGHVHNTYDEYLLNRFKNDAASHLREFAHETYGPTPINFINTFCGYSDYEPLSLEEWIEVDKIRRERINNVEQENAGTIDFDTWQTLNFEFLPVKK